MQESLEYKILKATLTSVPIAGTFGLAGFVSVLAESRGVQCGLNFNSTASVFCISLYALGAYDGYECFVKQKILHPSQTMWTALVAGAVLGQVSAASWYFCGRLGYKLVSSFIE